MQSRLQEEIKNKVVDPILHDRHHMVKGTVLYYNNLMNRATVEIHNRVGPGRKRLDGVPVQLGGGGFHSAGPFKGDEVWVSFIGGNIFFPRVVALADENYEFNTRAERMRHRRKGSLVPDSITWR